ncbi:MAG: hypothetical protein KA044_01910 [Elusimicrobia bacterium]|nr:hypothetical protein [Elusimicrobiota bacterium]
MSLCFFFAFWVFYGGGGRRDSLYFGFCNLFLGLWNISDIFTTFSPKHSSSLIIDRSSYFFATWLVGVLFLFCRAFLGPSFSSLLVVRIHLFVTSFLSFIAFTPLIIRDVIVRPEFMELPGPLFPIFALHMLLTTGYCLYSLRREWLKAEGERRNRIKYVFLAFIFGALTAVMYVISMVLNVASRSYLVTEIIYVSLIPLAILRSRMMDINLALRYTLVYLVMGFSLGLPLAGLVWMLSGEALAAALALVAPVAGYFAIQNVSPWFIGLVDRLPIFQGKYNGLRNLERQERNVALSGNLATWAERLLEGASALVKPETGFVLVREEGDRSYLVKAGMGLNPARRVFLSIPSDSPLVARGREGKMILADSVGFDSDSTGLAEELKFLGAVAVVPLMHRETVYAFLCLGPKVGRDMLNDVDLAGLYGLARSAELTLNTLLSGSKSETEKEAWAHDLLRPFGGKGSFRGLREISKDDRLPEDVRRALGRIQADAEFVGRNLRRVVDGGPETAAAEGIVSMGAMYRRLEGKYAPLFRESGVDLAVGGFVDHGGVRGEEGLIERRLLDNLLENALRHTPRGGRVEMGGRVEGETFLGWVKDSGAGIPAELKNRLFEPGAQGGDRSGLAGLGLYSAKTTLESFGGKVWVESEPGQGAAFYFSLPFIRRTD